MDLNKKVTIEDLKSKFGDVINVEPYGPCVIVPGDEFDPDWEADLADQGYMCREVLANKKPVTLVPLKKVSGEPEKSVPKPLPKPVSSSKKISRDWSPEEDKVLVEKWKEDKLTIREIQEQCFPTRSKESVGMHVWDLQQKGIIQRKQVKGGRPKGTKKPERKQKELKKTTDHSDDSKVPFMSTEDPMLKVLKEILDCLRGFEPVTFSFECHCRKCGDNRSIHDEDEVWRVCPRCGEPLIIWNVQS
jgi:hypothetical protein